MLQFKKHKALESFLLTREHSLESFLLTHEHCERGRSSMHSLQRLQPRAAFVTKHLLDGKAEKKYLRGS
uniref:Uncharacterized protein n=1 Tax=Steinernema glaseri TaxID=37863 RepID=A0A1I7Z6Z3_9BILA